MKNIPQRPRRESVKLAAISRYLEENDLNWDAATIANIANRSTFDGFDLMIELITRYQWDFERDDLDILDEIVAAIDDAHDVAELEWTKEHDVYSKALPIGTLIEQGRITGIYQYQPARYLVQESNSEDGRLLILKFEDAVLES